MKLSHFTLMAVSGLVLMGCQAERHSSADIAGSHGYSKAARAPVVVQDAATEVVGGRERVAGKVRPSSPADRDNPSAASYLAYSYNYGYELPAKAVSPTMQAHAKTCMEAGPNICQVLNSNTSGGHNNYASAQLRLRAEPEWLKTFSNEMSESVKEAKGKMVNSNVSAEDLTRSILDTDARLKAQKTLRTRLEGLLETRDAKLPDLLALERELARVQGEIESQTTRLNVLKKRVSMSVVNINYQSESVAVSGGTFTPITNALKGFFGELSYGIAGVIEFFARILPWLIFVILPGLWLLRRFWRGRKSKKASS